jgi:tetratricopeptide (TPR) repeat protein
MKESVAPLLCAASLVLAGKLGQAVQPHLKAPVGMTLHQQEALEESAVASVFGEFRASLADFLWLEADRYLHFGVGTRGRLDSEKNDAKVGKVQGVVAHDTHHDETTIVPSATSDWRGLLGHIERETQPYMDMSHHQERDAKEALPLFRLMTWSNPRFVQGYVQGAMQMASRPEKRQEALEFLLEGERNNPESISIQVTLCELYYRNLKQLEAAEPHGRKALELYATRDKATLSQDEQADANSAFRWLVGIYRDLGDVQSSQGAPEKAQTFYGMARQIAIKCLRYYPEDPTAIHFLRNNPNQ